MTRRGVDTVVSDTTTQPRPSIYTGTKRARRAPRRRHRKPTPEPKRGGDITPLGLRPSAAVRTHALHVHAVADVMLTCVWVAGRHRLPAQARPPCSAQGCGRDAPRGSWRGSRRRGGWCSARRVVGGADTRARDVVLPGGSPRRQCAPCRRPKRSRSAPCRPPRTGSRGPAWGLRDGMKHARRSYARCQRTARIRRHRCVRRAMLCVGYG